MKKLAVALCAVAVALALGSCTARTIRYDKNTQSGYDYILDNMRISSGVWANNWGSTFNDATKDFVPSVTSRKYTDLQIYLGEIHANELVFDVGKPDDNVYIEMYMIYADATGVDVARLLTKADEGLVYKLRRTGWNLTLDFDNMPPTTKALKIKIQKGHATKYVDAEYQG